MNLKWVRCLSKVPRQVFQNKLLLNSNKRCTKGSTLELKKNNHEIDKTGIWNTKRLRQLMMGVVASSAITVSTTALWLTSSPPHVMDDWMIDQLSRDAQFIHRKLSPD